MSLKQGVGPNASGMPFEWHTFTLSDYRI